MIQRKTDKSLSSNLRARGVQSSFSIHHVWRTHHTAKLGPGPCDIYGLILRSLARILHNQGDSGVIMRASGDSPGYCRQIQVFALLERTWRISWIQWRSSTLLRRRTSSLILFPEAPPFQPQFIALYLRWTARFVGGFLGQYQLCSATPMSFEGFLGGRALILSFSGSAKLTRYGPLHEACLGVYFWTALNIEILDVAFS